MHATEKKERLNTIGSPGDICSDIIKELTTMIYEILTCI